VVLPPQPPECWYYRHVPLHSAQLWCSFNFFPVVCSE
jgi:hypothetical protein